MQLWSNVKYFRELKIDYGCRVIMDLAFCDRDFSFPIKSKQVKTKEEGSEWTLNYGNCRACKSSLNWKCVRSRMYCSKLKTEWFQRNWYEKGGTLE